VEDEAAVVRAMFRLLTIGKCGVRGAGLATLSANIELLESQMRKGDNRITPDLTDRFAIPM
jgi:hypothetical protein